MDSDRTSLVLDGTALRNFIENAVYCPVFEQEGLLEPSGIPIPTLKQKINLRAF